MAGITRFGFMAIAVAFHLVYILSIFDIYFVSPIVSGMRLFKVERGPEVKAPADRLVLFVGDGLRADKAFQSFPPPYPSDDDPDPKTPRPLAPFLRSRVLEHGTFGVSHTRVPTESRPGHVALIAGLYEDVSAVTTGWKLNPVNFDSVFNRSRHTWSWGSPDILPMFEEGAVPGRVDGFTYGAEFEDFSMDSTELDIWVFDHVKKMFAEAATNATLDRALREDKVVFFLHLLGLDTAGHGFRPYSKEYLHNIKVVDKGVQEITQLIQNFYDDDRTAFVFTADHGMSDWGSHGDGHPDNTRTPLVAWGSGVATPVLSPDGTMGPGHDEYSSDWGFDQVKRHDVQQADVAALMAYLLGTEFPANSVGELPLSYLAADLADKAEASLVNARGILEMYRVKEEKKKAGELRYRPFHALSSSSSKGQSPQARIEAIRKLIDAKKYEEAIEEADTLLHVGLEGMRYLQTYDWLFLRALITIGYLGWMAFAMAKVIDSYVLQSSTPASRSVASNAAFSSVLVAMYASFVLSGSPVNYYAYAFFPVLFWEEVYAQRHGLAAGSRVLFGHMKTGASMASFAMNVVLYIAVIVSLAVGYIHREVLTVLYLLGAFWPLTGGLNFVQEHAVLCATWLVSCVVMSTFTLFPAMKVENIPLVIAGGLLMALIGIVYLVFEDLVLSDFSTPKTPMSKKHGTSRILTGIQVGWVLLAMIVTRSSALSLQSKKGLPPGNQVVGFLVLIVPFFMPLAYRLQPNNHYMHRLLVMFLTCAPTFVLLTISYEGLFYVAFSVLLVAWVRLEHQLLASNRASAPAQPVPAEEGGHSNGTTSSKKKKAKKAAAAAAALASQQQQQDHATSPAASLSPSSSPSYRPLDLADMRVALFFFVLLQSAFFSTGNMASISAFSLESVQRLLPIFDPFSQGGLLVLKLVVPFVFLSANLGVLNVRLGVAPSALFMLALAVSDILTLYFFWVVKDEGSWLEIGSTISHFVIASLLCVFVAALESVSSLLIAGIEVDGHGGVAPQEAESCQTQTVVGGQKQGSQLEAAPQAQQAPGNGKPTGGASKAKGHANGKLQHG